MPKPLVIFLILLTILVSFITGLVVGHYSLLAKIDDRAKELNWMEYKGDDGWQYKQPYKYDVYYLKYGHMPEDK